MPKANIIEFDFANLLPEEVLKEKFDAIIFSYSIHHLNMDEKLDILSHCKKLLNKKGSIIIGDVMCKTQSEMHAVQTAHNDTWNYSEYYVIADDLFANLPEYNAKFIEKSYCSGIIILK